MMNIPTPLVGGGPVVVGGPNIGNMAGMSVAGNIGMGGNVGMGNMMGGMNAGMGVGMGSGVVGGGPVVPTQMCSHPSHQAWWGTHPEQPMTDFYHRSSKCKKCYIRQQQESKTRRVTPESPSTATPPKMPFTNTTPLSNTRLGPAPSSVGARPSASPMGTGINFGGVRSFTMPTFSTPAAPGATFGGANQTFTPSLPLSATPNNQNQPLFAPPQQATTPFILSRPPREVNKKVLASSILKRCKTEVIDVIRNHENSWPFNQPVDPVALGLNDYTQIIKKPMDLRTVDENLIAGRYASETQFLEDVRLVFENARTYNKVNSEIYDYAVQLSDVFETLYKRVSKECEHQAKTEAEKEVRSDICAFCGFGVVIPNQRAPMPAPPPPSLQKVQPQTQQITFQPSPAPSQPAPSSLSSSSGVASPPTAAPSSPPIPSSISAQPLSLSGGVTPSAEIKSVASPTLPSSPTIPSAVPTPNLSTPATSATPNPATSIPGTPVPSVTPVSSIPTSLPSSPPIPSSAPRPPLPTAASFPSPSIPKPLPGFPSTPSPALSSIPKPTPVPTPAPTPLLHCDGACLRAFHPHCLALSEYTSPWLCNECRTGKPVLHWDPAKTEYFYYFYDTTEAPAPSTDDEEFSEFRSIGALPREAKRKLREEEEENRQRGEMYFDDMWCMWRCRSRDIVQQRDERQKNIFKKLSPGR